jgi:hypothetical protein
MPLHKVKKTTKKSKALKKPRKRAKKSAKSKKPGDTPSAKLEAAAGALDADDHADEDDFWFDPALAYE